MHQDIMISNKVIESKYYTWFHCYFIGDWSVGLPPRLGEADKRPIWEEFQVKSERISNSVWLKCAQCNVKKKLNNQCTNPLDRRKIHHYNQIVIFMWSSEEIICKTWGEVCILSQIVYKHQIQQPSTMSIIISTVLLRQDFMQKIVVINFFYLWVRHLGSPSLLVH